MPWTGPKTLPVLPVGRERLLRAPSPVAGAHTRALGRDVELLESV